MYPNLLILLDRLYGLDNSTACNPGETSDYWVSVMKTAYMVIHLLT